MGFSATLKASVVAAAAAAAAAAPVRGGRASRDCDAAYPYRTYDGSCNNINVGEEREREAEGVEEEREREGERERDRVGRA